MSFTQITTYLHHFFCARHYRGHGIHSPYLYSFVREVVIRRGNLAEMIKKRYSGEDIEVVDDVKKALESNCYITIIHRPFKTDEQRRYWKRVRPHMKILTVHLPHDMIIFRDDRLHNQHFMIRR